MKPKSISQQIKENYYQELLEKLANGLPLNQQELKMFKEFESEHETPTPKMKWMVTTSQMADFFGVTPRAVNHWIKNSESPCPQVRRGWFHLKDAFAWWLESIYQDSSDKDETLIELKRQHEIERIKITKMKAGTMEGGLILKDAIVSAWCDRMRIVRSSLLQLEFRLPNLLEGTTIIEKKKVVHDECRKILEGYCQTGVYTVTTTVGDGLENDDREAIDHE